MSDNVKGILWIISRGFWATVAVIIIRQLSIDLPLLFILSFVNILIVIKMLGWFAITGRLKPKTKHIHLYVVRALIGLVSMGMWMYAATVIPIATLTALNFTAPLFTVILAIALLKEKGTIQGSVGLVAGFIGVIMILRPDVETFNVVGLIVLFSAFLYSVVNLMVKHLTKFDSPKSITFFTWIMMLVFSLPLALIYWNTPNMEQIVLLILLAIVSNLTIFSMSQAYSKAALVVVMPFEFIGLIFAIIAGYMFFQESLDLWVILGGITILSGAIYATRNIAK